MISKRNEMSLVVDMSPSLLIEQAHLMLRFTSSACKLLVQLEIAPFPSLSKPLLERRGKKGFTDGFNAFLSHRSDT